MDDRGQNNSDSFHQKIAIRLSNLFSSLQSTSHCTVIRIFKYTESYTYPKQQNLSSELSWAYRNSHQFNRSLVGIYYSMPKTVTNSVVAIATFILGSICLWNPERCFGLHPNIGETINASRASKEGHERFKNIYPDEAWWMEDCDYRYRIHPEELGSFPWGKRALWKWIITQFSADGKYLREMVSAALRYDEKALKRMYGCC